MTISIKSAAAAAMATALTALTVFAGAACAVPWSGHQQQRVDNRQAHQSERITRGVEQGQITPREQFRLERQQRHVNGMERRIEADGKVTPYEAVRVERVQDRASHDIYRARHNPRGR